MFCQSVRVCRSPALSFQWEETAMENVTGAVPLACFASVPRWPIKVERFRLLITVFSFRWLDC